MKIIVNGKLTVYPPRGSYQLDIRSIKPAGLGELQEAFEKLKKNLKLKVCSMKSIKNLFLYFQIRSE